MKFLAKRMVFLQPVTLEKSVHILFRTNSQCFVSSNNEDDLCLIKPDLKQQLRTTKVLTSKYKRKVKVLIMLNDPFQNISGL